MEHVSLAGIVVAVVAVFLAYFMGYANGVSFGRNEGYDDGKREGSREDSMHAYAVGFDRGKRARDDDDDDEEDDEEDAPEGLKSNLGFAIMVVAAGLFAILWFSSHTEVTPVEYHGGTGTLPTVIPTEVKKLIQPQIGQATQDVDFPGPQPSMVNGAPFNGPDSVALPRIHRSLPTTTPLPTSEQWQYQTPAEYERSDDRFPHPPPAFGR